MAPPTVLALSRGLWQRHAEFHVPSLPELTAIYQLGPQGPRLQRRVRWSLLLVAAYARRDGYCSANYHRYPGNPYTVGKVCVAMVPRRDVRHIRKWDGDG